MAGNDHPTGSIMRNVPCRPMMMPTSSTPINAVSSISSAWCSSGLTLHISSGSGEFSGCREFADVQDDGGADGFEIRMAEFEPHAAADESRFQHGAAPRGTVDGHRHG